jgi:hypothetical protein
VTSSLLFIVYFYRPCTGGTRWLGEARRCGADAACVARLRACGAVMAGKTNMHELGAGTSGINPHHGSSRNPYDTGRVSGGSSGGSAAAVCAGLCPVALGADGGGEFLCSALFSFLFLSNPVCTVIDYLLLIDPLTTSYVLQGPCACRRRSAAWSGSSRPQGGCPTPGTCATSNAAQNNPLSKY